MQEWVHRRNILSLWSAGWLLDRGKELSVLYRMDERRKWSRRILSSFSWISSFCRLQNKHDSVKRTFKKLKQEIITCLHGSSTTVASKQCRRSVPGNGNQKKEALWRQSQGFRETFLRNATKTTSLFYGISKKSSIWTDVSLYGFLWNLDNWMDLCGWKYEIQDFRKDPHGRE